MSDRRLWLFVVAWVIAITAAGSARSLLLLLGLAAVAAAWLAGQGRPGQIACSTVAAGAWMAAVGPWRGSARAVVGVAAACLALVAVAVARRLHPRAVRAAALVLVALSGVVATSVPTTGPRPETTRFQAVDRYVRAEVERAQLPGVAVAVVVDDRVAFEQGYGEAGDGEPMTVASPVVIGSTSKSITATAVLQLVEAGRVELDAPVRRYLSWFDPVDHRGSDITVRELLVDTSGVPTWAGWSALGGDGRADDAGIRRLINDVRLTSAPGARFQYSNANYIALGQVIEAVTGERYADYVRRAIFEPLGMQHTVAGELAGGATPNRYWFGTPVPSHLPYLEIGIPAGAISASADDLARYLQAQLHHGSAPDGTAILTASSVDLMQAPAVVAEGFGVPSGRHYAMGWYVGTVAGEHAVFHSGDVFDSSSSLVMLPEQRVGVVVVATTSSTIAPVANTLAEGVTDVLMGRPAKELGGALALGTVGLMAVVGIVLAFAVVRVRRLITDAPARRAAFTRLVVLDIVLPAAIIVGLPLAFSHYLDRAETVDPLTFWRLVTRGVPDVGYLVLIALLLRLGVAVSTLTRAALPRRA